MICLWKFFYMVNLPSSLDMDVDVAIISLMQSSCEVIKICIPCHASCKTYHIVNI